MSESDPVKQNIIDWCKEDGISCKILENPDFHFSIAVSNVQVYCQKKYPDRLYFQQVLNFDEKQKELYVGLNEQKKSNLIQNLSVNSINFDYHQSLLNEDEGKVLTGVMLYKFGSTDLTKNEFLKLFLRVQQIGNYTNSLLGNAFSVELNLKKMQDKSKTDANPLSG